MISVEPTIEDINALLQNNSNATQHLQIITLQRVIKEQDERIDDWSIFQDMDMQKPQKLNRKNGG